MLTPLPPFACSSKFVSDNQPDLAIRRDEVHLTFFRPQNDARLSRRISCIIVVEISSMLFVDESSQ